MLLGKYCALVENQVKAVKAMTFEGASMYYGDVDENSIPHGRGIVVLSNGTIVLRYFSHGQCVPGYYINIE